MIDNSHRSPDTFHVDLSGHRINRDGVNLDLQVSGALVEGSMCRRRNNPIPYDNPIMHRIKT